MIKLKHLIKENAKIEKLNAEIDNLFQKWRNAEWGEDRDAIYAEYEKRNKERDRIRDEDPYLGDKHAFLKHHYTGHIPSDAYQKYEKEGGLSWLGPKSKYPVLTHYGEYGEFEVEFRQTGDPIEYGKRIQIMNMIILEMNMEIY